MALQQGCRAADLAVVRRIGVALQIAVITLGIVVIEGIAQPCLIADPILGDRAQPTHPLLVATIFYVIVFKATAFVDRHFAANRLQYRRAPIGAIDLLVLVFQRQGMRKLIAEVGAQRQG